MICKPCRKGGEANKAFLANQSKWSASEAASWHAECKGGTWCDCQHFVGKGIAGREPK